MSKVISLKIKSSGISAGPFKVSTEQGTILAENISRKQLILGVNYTVNNNVNYIILESLGTCYFKKTFKIDVISIYEYANINYTLTRTTCMWRHLTDIHNYNKYYGKVESYVIEYPFSFKFQDEILQSVKDYTKAYKYLNIPDGPFSSNSRIEVNDSWFNQAILYNGQQSSGLLNLVPKPKNNLQAYNLYPKFNTDSKTITYTKNDNFYQYNTFWALQKSPFVPLFTTSCESLSIDKIVNQDNMDYNSRSFKKAPLRAKELKIRHILNNSSEVHLVSQFIVAPSQISYK